MKNFLFDHHLKGHHLFFCRPWIIRVSHGFDVVFFMRVTLTHSLDILAPFFVEINIHSEFRKERKKERKKERIGEREERKNDN